MDYSQIQQALRTAISFRQTFDSNSFPVLQADLIDQGGLYVNSVAEQWLTAENLSLTLDDFEQMQIDEWTDAKSYSAGDKVKLLKNGLAFIYVAMQAVSTGGASPDTNPQSSGSPQWETALSFRLRQFRDSAINEVIGEILTEKNVFAASKTLLAYTPLFRRRGRVFDQTKTGRLVAFQIKMPKGQDGVEVVFDKIGFTYDTAETITVRLFHESQTQPIQSFDVVVDPADVGNYVQKTLRDASNNPPILKYRSSQYDAGGRFYFGVFEDELTGTFKETEFCNYWSNCYDCNASTKPYDYGYYLSRRDYYLVRSVFIKNAPGPTLPDIGDSYSNVNDYERALFNLEAKVQCNPTQLIVDTAITWHKALQYKLAIMLLESMMHSSQLNRVSEQAFGQVRFLLYGRQTQNEFIEGITQKYDKVKREVIINLEGMDERCWSHNAMPTKGAQ